MLAALATTVARYLDGYSIYSVRLPAFPAKDTDQAGQQGAAATT